MLMPTIRAEFSFRAAVSTNSTIAFVAKIPHHEAQLIPRSKRPSELQRPCFHWMACRCNTLVLSSVGWLRVHVEVHQSIVFHVSPRGLLRLHHKRLGKRVC